MDGRPASSQAGCAASCANGRRGYRQPAARDWTAAWIPAVLPPLAAKLFQESDLRRTPAGRKHALSKTTADTAW